jgi:FkbM family methyltransferase
MTIIEKIKIQYRMAGLKGLLSVAWRKVFPPFNPINAALHEILKDDDFTIIQIGAHIGNTPNDPFFKVLNNKLKKYKGRLICIEPIKEYFEKLVENYRKNSNVFFENVAIADYIGEITIYRLSIDPEEHGFPEWLSQLSSLKKERMECLWDKYEAMDEYKAFYLKHRVEETVPCITFTELLKRYDLLNVDLLQIDVEGYELEILKTIDFDSIPIRFINYESVLLQDRKNEAERLLQSKGYSLFDHGQDTFCYKHNDHKVISPP